MHAKRNLLAVARASQRQVISALISTIFAQPDGDAARRQLRAVVDQLTDPAPQVAQRLQAMEDDLLAYTSFPPVHWPKIWSNNPISVNRPWRSVTGRGCTGMTRDGWILVAAGGGRADDGAAVVRSDDTWRLDGSWPDLEAVNRFLVHLGSRGFAAATVRAYAYDTLNFGRFCVERGSGLADVTAADIFDWVEWQTRGTRPASGNVVQLVRFAGAAPATVNRRVAAVRALFEHQVVVGARSENPVPAPRRGQGLRPKARGLLGYLGPGRPRHGGRLVWQPRRLPEALDPHDVAAFLADLRTHRDRAIVQAMLLGGLRAGEVRRLRLADVDQGRRTVRVVGKGNRERTVPVDAAFFVELAAYLRDERPAGLATRECFVVLRGLTRGRPLSEAGLRSVFRHHRASSGATRVRPHRLRHTYGTELAAAGIDLLVLRELMGHASPETTAGYVHLSVEQLAADYAAARAVMDR